MTALSKTSLVTKINDDIATNGSQSITGSVLNEVLTDIVDSAPNLIDQNNLLGLSEYDSTKTYNKLGEKQCVIYSGNLYQAKPAETNITGTWNASKWDLLTVSSDFHNGGDTATGTRRIGNNSNHDFAIETNNTDRIYIRNNGKIGIGETSTAIIDNHALYLKISQSNGQTLGLYNTGNNENSVLFYNNSSTATRRISAAIYSGLDDNTNAAEWGVFEVGLIQDGSEPAGVGSGIFRISQMYDDINSTLVDTFGIQVSNAGVSYSNALVHIKDALSSYPTTAEEYRIVLISSDNLTTNANIVDIRANGYIILDPDNMPTSGSGLPVGCLFRDGADNIKIKV